MDIFSKKKIVTPEELQKLMKGMRSSSSIPKDIKMNL